MTEALFTLAQGDALSLLLVLTLLGMSVLSWTVIVYKTWLLHQVSVDVPRGRSAFWHAPDVALGLRVLQSVDRCAMLLPLVQALKLDPVNTLAAQSDVRTQRTRVLRDALHLVVQRLQRGQVVLATVGATAPFVGLLGTVWGIYHALTGIAQAQQLTIEQIAGPVGESLIMTAAGLAVALPAVLAYNAMGRVVQRLEQELEGFAHDLRAL